MKTSIQSVLLSLSALILVAGVVIGALLVASPTGGGFFPDLGLALGLLALGAGNGLSFFLNAVCWVLGFRPRWFSFSLLVQALPAVLCAGWAANELWDSSSMDSLASAQRIVIAGAIAHDDLPALLWHWTRFCRSRTGQSIERREGCIETGGWNALPLGRSLVLTSEPSFVAGKNTDTTGYLFRQRSSLQDTAVVHSKDRVTRIPALLTPVHLDVGLRLTISVRDIFRLCNCFHLMSISSSSMPA